MLLKSVFNFVEHPSLLLCSEWNINKCHRSDIADGLQTSGLADVKDIWIDPKTNEIICKPHKEAKTLCPVEEGGTGGDRKSEDLGNNAMGGIIDTPSGQPVVHVRIGEEEQGAILKEMAKEGEERKVESFSFAFSSEFSLWF